MDDKFKSCRQFHGHIAGPFVIEYAADVPGGVPIRIRLARPIPLALGELSRRSHRRAGIWATQGKCAVGGPGDIEVEGEVLVDGEHVAQVALQRIAGVEALRAVA